MNMPNKSNNFAFQNSVPKLLFLCTHVVMYVCNSILIETVAVIGMYTENLNYNIFLFKLCRSIEIQ